MTEAQSEHHHIVVTGARGFLARMVVQGARSAGWRVTTAGRGLSTESVDTHYTCDASVSADKLAAWIAEVKPDIIFHGAGSADVRASFNDPAADLQASVGTWSLWLEAARLWGGRPLMIFPSSAAVYGAPEKLPVTESTACCPISPYGMHKWFCEQLAAQYHTHFGVPTVVLRLFSVFGPHQRRLLVWELYQRLQKSSPALEVLGSGNETRDYLFESDVVAAILLLAAEAKAIAEQGPRCYNLASGREISVVQLATLLRDLLGDTRPIHCKGEARLGDPSRWCADPSRFQAAFTTWSCTPLEEAMRQTLRAWSREGEHS
jgi:UDP-glucose 4-epimerase